MKLERMFEIVFLLLARKKVTASDLAQHFEVSKRTILRDIEALSLAGIPVYTEKGKGGGISLMENYVLDKALISREEQQQILFSLQSFAATGQLETHQLLTKLQTVFGSAHSDWIEVDFSRWGNTTADQEKFNLLKMAIIQERSLTFTYFSAHGEKSTKKVYPLKLIFKAKAWYLAAYCQSKADYRLYKINRMTNLQLSEELFSRTNFSFPEDENTTSTPTGQNFIELELLFSKEAAFRALDEFSQDNLQQNADGSLTVTTQLPEDEWLYTYLLSLGTSVKVIAPNHVRKNLLNYITNIKKSYESL